MGTYILRRSLFAIPTLLVISLIIFAILELAPGDPTAQLPLTLPAEIKEAIRESLGVNDPFIIKWLRWVQLMFINEPLHAIDSIFGTCIGDCESRARIISWSSRAPAIDVIYTRVPQTLWVLGLALLFGTLIGHPGRNRQCLQAVFRFRQHRNLRHDDRVLGPNILHWCPRHHDLQCLARVVPIVLRHHPHRRLDKLGLDLVPDQTDDHAGRRAHLVQYRRSEPVHPCVSARQPETATTSGLLARRDSTSARS